MTYKPTCYRLFRQIHHYCNFKEDGSWRCSGDFSATVTIMNFFGINKYAQEHIIDIFRATGGYCDCEILFNSEDKYGIIYKLINWLLDAYE